MKIEKYLTGVVLVILASLMGACTGNNAEPTEIAHSPILTENTPGPPQELVTEFIPSKITLLDGSVLYLDTDTEVQIISLNAGEGAENHFVLIQGKVMVISRQPEGTWFTVQNPSGYLGRVTGSVMIVWFDTETGLYHIVCVEGTCQYGDDPDNLLSLEPGFYVVVDSDGTVVEISAISDLDLYRFFEEYLPLEEVEPSATPTLTSTPDAAATATAVCADLRSEAPEAHCPEPDD